MRCSWLLSQTKSAKAARAKIEASTAHAATADDSLPRSKMTLKERLRQTGQQLAYTAKNVKKVVRSW